MISRASFGIGTKARSRRSSDRGARIATQQKSLLEEAIDADLAALQAELDKVVPDEKETKPKRKALPANLARREIHHEPENTTCSL